MRTFRVTHRVKHLVTIVSALTLAFAVTAGAGGGKTPATNNQDGSNDAKKPTYIAGEVVVAVEPGTTLGYLPAAPGEGGPLNMAGGADVYLLKLNEGENPETVAKGLMDSSWTLYAHPNYVLQEVHPVQGSYPFSDRLSLGNYEAQAASVALNVSDARAVSTGAGVRI
ncbi:MAG TPA: hypothetical protein VLB27_08320, partial [candidate division Zixibacteria bacterium]|nr:hypothetical protein [candidate division Zixibacteria bacterium]